MKHVRETHNRRTGPGTLGVNANCKTLYFSSSRYRSLISFRAELVHAK